VADGTTPAPTTPDPAITNENPVEVAMGAVADGVDPTGVSRTLLLEQTELIRAQRRAVRLEMIGERVSLVLKALLGLAGVGAAILVAGVVWSAADDESLVIEPFRTPPDFAERGLDGAVVSTQLLDRLGAMQAETESVLAAGDYRDASGDDIEVEIPQTGVSLGDLRRYLRDQLGKGARVTGEVVRTPAGLAVTARVSGKPGRTVVGPEAELDRLMQLAAESVLADTQPLRYADWLKNKQRWAEAEAVLAPLTREGSVEQRAAAYSSWTYMLSERGDHAAALEKARAARDLKPDDPTAQMWVASMLDSLGRDGEAWREYRKARPLWRDRSKLKGVDPEIARSTPLQIDANLKTYEGDFLGAAELYARPVAAGADFEVELAYALANGHEIGRARAALRDLRTDDAALARLSIETLGAERARDWGRALRAFDVSLNARLAADPTYAAIQPRFVWPRRAHLLARNGDLAGAQALLARTPTDCYDCLRRRGQVAALAGDAAGADRWFAAAVRSAPRLPTAYADWSEALIARGDLDRALTRADEAQERGPRWAEPMHLKGEALLRKGDARGAEKAFRAAAEIAPGYGRNQLLWGEALLRLGRRDEARERFDAARGLWLAPQDTTRLDNLSRSVAAQRSGA